MGVDGAVSAALPAGVESRAEPRGAAGVHARAARPLRPGRPRAWCAGGPHGQRDGAAARRRGVERESPFSHPRAGRGVHRGARGCAGVSWGAGEAARDARDTPTVTSRGPRQAHLEGFDLHANVWVGANDRAGLERLCRYVLRPPFAQERLRLRSDGRVALELKTPWHDGTRELVFEPLEFLERLAAMTPRPETNLLICHGVLAPRARWRERMVAYGRVRPEPTASAASPAAGPDGTGEEPAARLELGGTDAPGVCCRRPGMPALRGPAAADRYTARSRRHSEDPRPPWPRPVEAEPRSRPARARRRVVS